MGTVKAIVGVVAVIFVFYAGFQIVPPELSNFSFQDDLRNIAISVGSNQHVTDQDVLDSVIRKAQEHGIALTPAQVLVQRIGTPGMPALFVAADYSVPVSLPGYSFSLHFTPSSRNK